MDDSYDIDAQANYEGLRFCPRCAAELEAVEVRCHRRLVCPECSYIFYLTPATVTCVLAESDGRILFVLRKYEPGAGKWCLPAGFVEAGEQPEESAVREVKEETGLDVEIEGVYDTWATDEDPRTPVVSIAYTARVVGGELAAGDDATEAGFFPMDGLPHPIAFADHRRIVREYVEERTRGRGPASDGRTDA
jgi:ADP-ribose pyrophosphatase YjhB (NUDIX family)